MRTIKTLLALAIVMTLCTALAACKTIDPGPTQTSDAITTAVPTEAPTESQSEPLAAAGLFDFALLDRLFSMTYADYCREEGRTVEPEDYFEGSVYCRFGKYGDNVMFFFDPDYDSEAPKVNDPDNSVPLAVFFTSPNTLTYHQPRTLGELKQWLISNNIGYNLGVQYEDGVFSCLFDVNEYRISINTENDSESDDAVFRRIDVHR